jgi:tetratricopeptide (TPR) repeat protein
MEYITRSKHIIYIIILIIVTFIVFYNTFYNGFLWDDNNNIINNPFLVSPSWENLKYTFFNKYGGSILPVKLIAYLIKYRLWKLNPLPYHIWNVILYIINIILIYILILNINKSPEIALVTSLLFSLHPIHSEVVAALSGGEYLYAFAFFLSSLIIFSKYICEASKNSFYYLSLLLYTMSILSKDFPVTLFPLFMIYDFCFISKLTLKSVREKILIYIPFIIIPSVFLYISMFFTSRVKHISGLSILYHFLMDLQIITLFYIKNLFYPSGLNPMYNIRFIYMSLLILSTGLFIIILLLLILSWKTSKEFFFFLMFFIFSIVPYTHFIVKANIVAADRYIYAGSLSFCYFLALILFKIYRFKDKRICKLLSVCLLTVLLVSYTTITISQNRKWENEMILWTYVTGLDEKYKDNALAFTYLGDAYLKDKDLDNAIKYYEKALSYTEGDNQNLRLILGLAYMDKGDYDKAIDNLEKGKKLERKNIFIHNNLAIAYSHRKLYDKAIEEYKRSLKINPEQSDVKKNLEILLSGEK